MSPFQAALAAGQDAHAALCGVRVTLTRGADETADVLATPGQTTFTVEDGEGARLRRTVRDYLIRATAYQIDGSATEPQAGDLITETFSDSTERTYEVHPLQGGDPPWRWSDNAGRVYRIHTRDVTAP